MERSKRMGFLIKLSDFVEHALEQGMYAEEIKSAVNVGINAYERSKNEVDTTD